MKSYKIIYPFSIIIIPNKFNQLVKEETQFDYREGEIIKSSRDIRYQILSKIDEGELLPNIEWKGIATTPILTKNEKTNKFNVVGTAVINFLDFSQLEGLNGYETSFVEVIE